MAKLFNILVASVGGGMALGFGVRAMADAGNRRGTGTNGHGESGGQLSQMDVRLRKLERAGANPEAIQAAVAAAEERLRRATEREVAARAADAVEKALAGPVGARLEKLEAAVMSQEASMRELRECSLNTERNMQKLLAGIDRLVAAQEKVPSGRSEAGPGEASLSTGPRLVQVGLQEV